MITIGQRIKQAKLSDLSGGVREQLEAISLKKSLRPGMTIAVTAGSRGITNIGEILFSVVKWLKELQVEPFIVPAMGSHGGASALGQVSVLATLGITEKSMGVPIRSCMDVEQIGTTAGGLPIWMDTLAAQADGVFLVGRVKPHTDFHSPGGIESGLTKMAVIGLGNHQQAQQIHARGVPGLRELIPEIGRFILASGRILGGLAVVENARHETAILKAIEPGEILEQEALLLKEAYSLMPKLPVADLDILLVDYMGKDFSGTGLDTNLIGRTRIYGEPDSSEPKIRYIIVSDLSDSSEGNALGVGLSDFTTQRLFDKINWNSLRENVVTSTFIERGKIPMVLDSTRECLEVALRCLWGVEGRKVRLMRIPNTLHLDVLQVSESIWTELSHSHRYAQLSGPQPLVFDSRGYLPSLSSKCFS